jgi:hypothetical protein
VTPECGGRPQQSSHHAPLSDKLAKKKSRLEFGMFMFSSISNQNCTAKIDPDATADATAERETQEKKEVV